MPLAPTPLDPEFPHRCRDAHGTDKPALLRRKIAFGSSITTSGCDKGGIRSGHNHIARPRIGPKGAAVLAYRASQLHHLHLSTSRGVPTLWLRRRELMGSTAGQRRRTGYDGPLLNLLCTTEGQSLESAAQANFDLVFGLLSGQSHLTSAFSRRAALSPESHHTLNPGRPDAHLQDTVGAILPNLAG